MYDLYMRLLNRFGFRYWWPGDTRDEILIGAILTQQTMWRNVELSIDALKRLKSLSISKISDMQIDNLETAIRSSGYYRQKAKRLKNACKQIMRYGGINKLLIMDIPELRVFLLSIPGIGEETADSIILYATEKPTFVVDNYTIRIMSRVYNKKMDYGILKNYFEGCIKKDAELYKDIHAQFVELGKNYCKKSDPSCDGCPLNQICLYIKED